MLTIAKLRAGPDSVDYYLASVASGIEDYYAGHGEAPGRWIGPAAARLGLDGEIDGDTLGGLMQGQLPGAERRLGGGVRANRTPGWDLTWSAPKSVSVLYGLGSDQVSRQVVAAHDAAVAEGLTYLDRWGVVSRRSIDGDVTSVTPRGMVVAGFRHRTSRAMDPQLHTHALVANAVERADGTWGAIDSRVFYRHAKTAGYVYQAVLRAELTARLGVEWGTVTKGVAELSGVAPEVRDLFSTRRREIEAELDARGASSIKAGRTAALRTRSTKTEAAGTDVLRETWRQRVRDAHLDPDVDRTVDADLGTDEFDRLTGGAVEVREVVSARQRRLVVDELMGDHGLTEQRTSFNRGDVARAWCERIDSTTVGVTADLVDQLVATTVADRRAVELGTGDVLDGVADRRRWSTTGLVALEHDIVDRAIDGRRADVGVADAAAVASAIKASPSLSDEQVAMVDAITSAGDRIQPVIGVAGSGKTFALGVANQAWTADGHTVVGVAFAGKAARGLEADSGIASSTIDMLLTDLDRPNHPGLPERCVLVVDEAGMVPTRKLAQLLDRTRPDTKIVLVGDHHQLPEIGAGGVLRGLAERCDDVPTLTENRRQHDLAERDALADVRDGDVRRGLDWYLTSGRVTPAVDMADARTALIDAWWADRSNGRTDQLMMAERRVDVARLNDAARRRFAAAGLLSAERIVAADRDYATGDLVMFGRNDYGLGVRNGERGHITALDPATDTVTVTVDDREISVPRTYIDAGHLVWGYAATVHKNQGATCDHGYLLASDALYRELGYVALSRGRIDNRIWTVTADADHDDDIDHAHHPAPAPVRDPIAELVASMERSAAHQLAIDEAKRLPQPVNPGDVDVDELLDRRDRIGADLYRTAPPRVDTELADAERRYRLAERRLDHADDHEWAARTASLDEARDQLDEYAAMQARFDTWAIDHADQLTERRALDRQIRDVLTEMTIAIEHDPPPMVVGQLGQPPVGVDARNEWRAAVVDMAIAAHYDQVGDQPEPAQHCVDDDLDIV